MNQNQPKNDTAPRSVDQQQACSAVLCDMLGCHEHATGEVQTGDEYIPLCELHRQAEMDRLTPKWRPLPPHPPNVKDQPTSGA